MATGAEVLGMLRPEGGWVISGDNFSSIQWISCDALTQKEFGDGFAAYDAWKAEQEAAKAAEKAALLNRLGITEAEACLLLS